MVKKKCIMNKEEKNFGGFFERSEPSGPNVTIAHRMNISKLTFREMHHATHSRSERVLYVSSLS